MGGQSRTVCGAPRCGSPVSRLWVCTALGDRWREGQPVCRYSPPPLWGSTGGGREEIRGCMEKSGVSTGGAGYSLLSPPVTDCTRDRQPHTIGTTRAAKKNTLMGPSHSLQQNIGAWRKNYREGRRRFHLSRTGHRAHREITCPCGARGGVAAV